MCLSNWQDVDVSVVLTRWWCVCRTDKLMIAFRCVCRTRWWFVCQTHKIVDVSVAVQHTTTESEMSISTPAWCSRYYRPQSFRLRSCMLPCTPPKRRLEGRTNMTECVLQALFKGVSTLFGLQNVEKCSPGNEFWNIGSTFQSRRLGSMQFSTVCSANSSLTHLKSEWFVR